MLTGTLENWIKRDFSFEVYNFDDGLIEEARANGCTHFSVYSGNVYGDTKGRFYEGQWIHTSYVISGPDEQGIVRTRNSTYKLGQPAV